MEIRKWVLQLSAAVLVCHDEIHTASVLTDAPIMTQKVCTEGCAF